jgi:hypothetical protein
MSAQGSRGDGRPMGSAPQNTVFRRPCFQIALSGTGPGARLGVRVVAAPPQHRGS